MNQYIPFKICVEELEEKNNIIKTDMQFNNIEQAKDKLDKLVLNFIKQDGGERQYRLNKECQDTIENIKNNKNMPYGLYTDLEYRKKICNKIEPASIHQYENENKNEYNTIKIYEKYQDNKYIDRKNLLITRNIPYSIYNQDLTETDIYELKTNTMQINGKIEELIVSYYNNKLKVYKREEEKGYIWTNVNVKKILEIKLYSSIKKIDVIKRMNNYPEKYDSGIYLMENDDEIIIEQLKKDEYSITDNMKLKYMYGILELKNISESNIAKKWKNNIKSKENYQKQPYKSQYNKLNNRKNTKCIHTQANINEQIKVNKNYVDELNEFFNKGKISPKDIKKNKKNNK